MNKLHGSSFEQLEFAVVIESYSNPESVDVDLIAIGEVIDDIQCCRFSVVCMNDPNAADGMGLYESTLVEETVAIYCNHAPGTNYGELLRRLKIWGTYVRLQEDKEPGVLKTVHFYLRVENLVLTCSFVVFKFKPPYLFSNHFKRDTNSLFEAITWYNNPANDIFPELPDGWRGDFY